MKTRLHLRVCLTCPDQKDPAMTVNTAIVRMMTSDRSKALFSVSGL